jgi:hypothetical protein
VTSPLNYQGGRQFPQSILDDLDRRLAALEGAAPVEAARAAHCVNTCNFYNKNRPCECPAQSAQPIYQVQKTDGTWKDVQPFKHPGKYSRVVFSAPPTPIAAQITACALMIKGICMTEPQAYWTENIESRIRYMLVQAARDTQQETQG